MNSPAVAWTGHRRSSPGTLPRRVNSLLKKVQSVPASIDVKTPAGGSTCPEWFPSQRSASILSPIAQVRLRPPEAIAAE